MRNILFYLSLALLISCNSQSEISKNLNCNPESYSNLETIEDFKKLFTVKFPDNWKTNLYYDNNQSSIYSGDTTKQLTETFLIDVTHISKGVDFSGDFIQEFKTSLANQKLVESTSYDLKFQKQNAYYSRAMGQKGKFAYQICNLFIQIDPKNYIHAKTEIYGDSLVNERICNAMSLIEKITY